MRLLLIEDDTSLAQGIRTALKPEGYTVDWLADGQQAFYGIKNEVFDLLLLDLGLPGLDGLSLLKKIRDEGKQLPVLILTARDAVADRIAGLDAGADDYLIKPFDITELKARVRALLRRSAGRAQTILQLGELELNPQNQQVIFQKQPVNLTRREFALLHELLNQPGHVFTRDHLQQLLYGWEEDVESNALEVHIHHLRKKLFPSLIRTLRGIGYVLDKDAQP
ncbi:MAG TPA: response regulator [Marinospirillum sp.]|uniref:response regulator n=1 Tax=Marinospirillum sp. TaxID=2183934 RepID=UPI002B489BE7|nr:response regulator [Marinospirillum sp.]HKM15187.1 response regulator [Marinospirillum sp.]